MDILNLLATFLQRMAEYVKGWEKNYAVELKVPQIQCLTLGFDSLLHANRTFFNLFFFLICEQDTCLVVYTKDKAAKCRGPALELLIQVSKGLLLKLNTEYLAVCAFVLL